MRTWLTAAASLGAIAFGTSANAETLRQALTKTVSTNPTLAAQRQLVEAVEEEIPIAQSATRPQIQSRLGVDQDLVSTFAEGRRAAASVELEWPFFDGGRTSNRVRSARALHRAEIATLRSVEGNVLTEAVAAYVDVLQARAVVSLQENQVVVLDETLTATRSLVQAGDLNLTDIGQAEARSALAKSNLALARARLRTLEETYARVVGEAPGALEQPALLHPLPASADEAEAIALENNPDLQAAAEEVRSAGFLVNAIRADRLPRVSALASGRYVNFLGTADELIAPGAPENQSAATVGLTAAIPLYQGGSVAARVRQAQAERTERMERMTEVERQVIARARSAFASYHSALQTIQSNEVAVAANEIALEGTREEFQIGTRVLLDVLNAEQELLTSRVARVSAQRDAYLAGFSLLNAIGLATARELDLPVEPPDRTPNRGPQPGLSAPGRVASVEPVPERPPPALPTEPQSAPRPALAQAAAVADSPASNPVAPSTERLDPATIRPALPTVPPATPVSPALPVQPVQGSASSPTTPAIPFSAPNEAGQGPSRALTPLVGGQPATAGEAIALQERREPASAPGRGPSATVPTSVPAANAIVPPGPAAPAGPPVAGAGLPSERPQGAPARPGQFVVQVASYRSAADAMAGWRQLNDRLGLADFTPLTTTITLPNRGRFHRLAVGGFDTRAEAVRICQAIKRDGGACFVRAQDGDRPLGLAGD